MDVAVTSESLALFYAKHGQGSDSKVKGEEVGAKYEGKTAKLVRALRKKYQDEPQLTPRTHNREKEAAAAAAAAAATAAATAAASGGGDKRTSDGVSLESVATQVLEDELALRRELELEAMAAQGSSSRLFTTVNAYGGGCTRFFVWPA